MPQKAENNVSTLDLYKYDPQEAENNVATLNLYKYDPQCNPTNAVFQNEEPKDPNLGSTIDPNYKYKGSVENLNEEMDIQRVRKNRSRGVITYKYRNLGKFEDLGNIQPKTAYEEDGSNQPLFDIVPVRLSLVNEDFVHRSRYISGQPFGFTHDVLIVEENDKWKDEEVDSYESGLSNRQGDSF